MSGLIDASGRPLGGPAPLRKVMIATPTYDGKTTAGFTRALVDTILQAATQRILVRWWPQPGIPYLTVARNKCVREFLASDADDLVFIDSDVTWEPAGFLRLLTWDKDFVAGVYPYKRLPESYPVKYAFDDQHALKQCPQTNLIECDYVPSGFLRLRRAVFDRMIAALGGEDALRIVEYDHHGAELGRYLCLFETPKRGERYLGEDVDFCRLWRDKAGGQVWCDPELRFWHTGPRSYEGHLADYLRAEMARQAEAQTDTSSAA